ncbi:uncharacterized protein B0I36DRAFT_369516 [Microdochium trichocladiopsis]|uniref:Uncharacterized protein n=1 Tax=Microdochium trichocladiopsis TaxID=1682393 RepID=A0A9P8XSU1_9PEZI|nr:uncharacterized protein B0I36DRAFT_369516 [Microdochium trichocladiopsis]KAH7014575.1 hypothetical protein B0I36DRAFT_369516 [Microdochium trichocladiopsis]
MSSTKLALGALLAAMATGASAGSLKIHSYCSSKVTVVLSHNGGCDYGTDSRCIRDGSKPWTISSGATTAFNWITSGNGVSVKISKEGVNGILQYEYAMATGQYGGLYWDLSDLDGKGNGLVGTPFFNDNVKVSPTGNGEGQGTCVKIRCQAGKVCLDSYQHPDDPNTKWCPADTGDMWLDLCQPESSFWSRAVAEEDITYVTPTPPQEPEGTAPGPAIPTIVRDYFIQQAAIEASAVEPEVEEPTVTKVGRAYYA